MTKLSNRKVVRDSNADAAKDMTPDFSRIQSFDWEDFAAREELIRYIDNLHSTMTIQLTQSQDISMDIPT